MSILERKVYASTDKKNWIFMYTRLVDKYYNISNKQVTWLAAHTPVTLFDYALVIDLDENGKIVRQELRDLK